MKLDFTLMKLFILGDKNICFTDFNAGALLFTPLLRSGVT
jgi:hypothetical protein